MPRAGLNTTAVVDAALGLIDEEGVEALSLASVADRTGVAAPSLYNHVNGLSDLRSLVAVQVMDEMTRRFTAAVIGRSGHEAVAALMRAYRSYVLEHPARYSMLPPDPLRHPALHAAGVKLLEVPVAVFAAFGMPGPEAVHATRGLRAIAHGFASIEAAGGFGLEEDPGQSYDQLIQMFLASLPGRRPNDRKGERQ